MKEKLTNLWLWAVAVAFTVAAICTSSDSRTCSRNVWRLK